MSHTIADQYVAAVNAADLDALIGLFDAAGSLSNPIGNFNGHEELTAFYEGVVLHGGTVAHVERVAVDDQGTVFAEVKAYSRHDPTKTVAHALDVFTMNGNGTIKTLEIYYR